MIQKTLFPRFTAKNFSPLPLILASAISFPLMAEGDRTDPDQRFESTETDSQNHLSQPEYTGIPQFLQPEYDEYSIGIADTLIEMSSDQQLSLHKDRQEATLRLIETAIKNKTAHIAGYQWGQVYLNLLGFIKQDERDSFTVNFHNATAGKTFGQALQKVARLLESQQIEDPNPTFLLLTRALVSHSGKEHASSSEPSSVVKSVYEGFKQTYGDILPNLKDIGLGPVKFSDNDLENVAIRLIDNMDSSWLGNHKVANGAATLWLMLCTNMSNSSAADKLNELLNKRKPKISRNVTSLSELFALADKFFADERKRTIIAFLRALKSVSKENAELLKELMALTSYIYADSNSLTSKASMYQLMVSTLGHADLRSSGQPTMGSYKPSVTKVSEPVLPMNDAYDEELEITDLLEVITLLKNVDFPGTHYHQLGLELGLRLNTLSTIEADFRETNRRFKEVLARWLRWNHDLKEKGKPSIATLVEAVEAIQPASADAIRKAYQKETEAHELSDYEFMPGDLDRIITALKNAYFGTADWSSLGLSLGIVFTRLNVIERDLYRESELCMRRVLELWLKGEGGARTKSQLIKAVARTGNNAAAERLEFSL